MDLLFAFTVLSGVGALLTLADIERRILNSSSRRASRYGFVSLPILLVILTAVSVFLWQQNRRMNDMQAEASELYSGWEHRPEFRSTDDHMEIIEGGLAFLENHEDLLPTTASRARKLADAAQERCLTNSEAGGHACSIAAAGIEGIVHGLVENEQ